MVFFCLYSIKMVCNTISSIKKCLNVFAIVSFTSKRNKENKKVHNIQKINKCWLYYHIVSFILLMPFGTSVELINGEWSKIFLFLFGQSVIAQWHKNSRALTVRLLGIRNGVFHLARFVFLFFTG